MPNEILTIADRLMIRWTAVIAISGIVAAIIFGLQLAEMKSGSADTHDLAAEAKSSADSAKTIAEKAGLQAAATNTLAEEAKRQADYMKQLAERTLAQVNAANKLAEASRRQAATAQSALALSAEFDRPWMGMLGISVAPDITDGKESTVTLTIINSGRRPAHIFNFHLMSNVFDKFPVKPPFFITQGSGVPSQSIILPGQNIGTQMIPNPLNPILAQSVNSGRLTFYVYGSVEYEDIGTRNRHTTKFCQFYIPAQKKFGYCPEYNGAT
jgi:hypothetical protein